MWHYSVSRFCTRSLLYNSDQLANVFWPLSFTRLLKIFICVYILCVIVSMSNNQNQQDASIVKTQKLSTQVIYIPPKLCIYCSSTFIKQFFSTIISSNNLLLIIIVKNSFKCILKMFCRTSSLNFDLSYHIGIHPN